MDVQRVMRLNGVAEGAAERVILVHRGQGNEALRRRWAPGNINDRGLNLMPSSIDNDTLSHSARALEVLGKRFGTDKLAHGYLPNYAKYVADRRADPIVMVEIGLKKRKPGFEGCESLKMWREFFPSARVIGIDIIDVTALPAVENTELYQCDCTDAREILDVFSKHDIFPDIVVDDGAHTPKSHQIALGAIFPRMKAGGTYFIEDLQVCKDPGVFKKWAVTEENNTLTYLRGLQSGEAPRSVFLDDETDAYIRRHTNAVHFENNEKLAVIRKF